MSRLMLFASRTQVHLNIILCRIHKKEDHISGQIQWQHGCVSQGELITINTGDHCTDFVLVMKAPVTPSRVFTALERICLVFQSAVRSQETLIFYKKKT